ncbi:MAG: hypothetical protein ABIB71_02135 [Candidatus Woesearchaeota archaeon]
MGKVEETISKAIEPPHKKEKRKLKGLLKVYLFWTIFSAIVFAIIQPYLPTPLFIWSFRLLTAILIIKDVFDNFDRKFIVKVPEFFDHAPFVLLCCIFFFGIDWYVFVFSAFDLILDVSDDLSKVKW